MEKELNYKEAYLCVFNARTDLTRYLKQIKKNLEQTQSEAEEALCERTGGRGKIKQCTA